ncbi:hypothetical protein [Amycolatopsis sp. NPDC004378]
MVFGFFRPSGQLTKAASAIEISCCFCNCRNRSSAFSAPSTVGNRQTVNAAMTFLLGPVSVVFAALCCGCRRAGIARAV